MKIQHRSAALSTIIVTLFASSFVPASGAFAQENPSTGTLVGTVTCGDAAIAPASDAIVEAQGSNIEVLTDSIGRFTLSNVPAGGTYTIRAMVDPLGSVSGILSNVIVVPGQTVDVGNIDLAVCPAPAPPVSTQDELAQQQENRTTPAQEDNPNTTTS